LEQAPLLVAQTPGYRDIHEHPVVAAAEPLQHRHAAPPQHADLTGLRPRLEAQLDLAVESREAGRGAEGGLRHGQVDRGEDVVALADEPRITSDVDEHEEIAGPPAGRPGVAFPAQADPLPV